jgi:hypothetical protein
MAKTPAPNATANDVYLMPYEGGSTTTDATRSLFDHLASDEEFVDETTEEENEPALDESDEDEESNDSTDEVEESDEDEDDPEEEDEEPEASAETFKVKVDGKEQEVTLDELTKGYSRTADYTRKTQALAETRKVVEAEAAQLRQEREQTRHLLTQAEEFLSSQVPAEPDWDQLRQENPAEFAAQWAEHQRMMQSTEAVRHARQRIEQQQMQAQQVQMQQYLEAERQRLFEAIPEWQSTDTFQKEKAQLREYATSLGYTDEDLGKVYDHRLMLVLRDAARYRALSTKGREVVETKKAKTKVLQPGTRAPSAPSKSKQKEMARAKDRLARTGRVDDAAAAIMNFLDD